MFLESNFAVAAFATVGAAAPQSAQSVFTNVFTTLIEHGPKVAEKLVPGCLQILAVCVAIRLVKALIDALFSDDAIGAVGDAFSVVLSGFVCMMVITHVSDISGVVWTVADETMAVMSVGDVSGSGVADISTRMMEASWKLLLDVYNLYFNTEAAEGAASGSAMDKLLDWLGMALTGAGLLHVLIGLIVLLMTTAYAAILALQLTTGGMQITIAIGFLPIVFAFYPIIENWAKNAIGVIAAGIAHLGICAFLISLVSQQATGLATALSSGGFTIFGETVGGSQVNKIIASVVFAAVLLVLGLATGKSVGFATSIFGSTGGMMGKPSHGRGGGSGSGGGNANNTGGAGGGAGGGVVPGVDAGGAGGAAGGASGAGQAGAKVGASSAAQGGAAASGAAAGGVGAVATTAAVAGANAAQAAGGAALGAAGLSAPGGGKSGASGGAAGGTGGSSSAAGGGGGFQASAGSKAGMAAALIGAAGKQALKNSAAALKPGAARVGSAGKAVGKAVGKGAAKVGGHAVRVGKAAVNAQVKGTLRG